MAASSLARWLTSRQVNFFPQDVYSGFGSERGTDVAVFVLTGAPVRWWWSARRPAPSIADSVGAAEFGMSVYLPCLQVHFFILLIQLAVVAQLKQPPCLPYALGEWRPSDCLLFGPRRCFAFAHQQLNVVWILDRTGISRSSTCALRQGREELLRNYLKTFK